MTVQCCVCHKVRLGPQWVPPSKPGVMSDASHGYCPECEALAYEALRSHVASGVEPMREVI